MKAEDVEPGPNKAGLFTINVSSSLVKHPNTCWSNASHIGEGFSEGGHEDYFHVMLTEGDNFYVHLVNDERFQYFKHLSEFSRAVTDIDLAEYNHYVNTKQLVMPTFKMHRHSIVALVDKCQALTKTLRKKK